MDAGKAIIVLSDQFTDATKVPVPMLLAVGAVHHHLLRRGKRLRASLVCETGEARDVHHFACLVGYGASAVNPYLAIETIGKSVENGEYANLTFDQALANFRGAIESGMLKVMAKMGISTVSSYRGAQVFEAIGLSRQVVDRCFDGTTSQIGGITLLQIGEDTLRRHAAAYAAPEPPVLEEGGNYRVPRGGKGEFHATNPQVVTALHRFNKTGNARRIFQIPRSRRTPRARGAARFVALQNPDTGCRLDEVEPIENDSPPVHHGWHEPGRVCRRKRTSAWPSR